MRMRRSVSIGSTIDEDVSDVVIDGVDDVVAPPVQVVKVLARFTETKMPLDNVRMTRVYDEGYTWWTMKTSAWWFRAISSGDCARLE